VPLSIEAAPQVYKVSDSEDLGNNSNTIEHLSLSLATLKGISLLQQLKLIELFNLVTALEALKSSSLAIVPVRSVT
jgi:hypothetical protein